MENNLSGVLFHLKSFPDPLQFDYQPQVGVDYAVTCIYCKMPTLIWTKLAAHHLAMDYAMILKLIHTDKQICSLTFEIKSWVMVCLLV